MRRFAAILTLLWCGLWAGASLWGACPANNPVSFNAIPMQGPDPTGNQGYPMAVVGATGCPLDVNVVGGGGGGGCVTQCTSPWVVSGTVAATQSGAWTVGINNFPATQPVSGTVTANQGTPGASAWPFVQWNSANQASELLDNGNPHAVSGHLIPEIAATHWCYDANTNQWQPAWGLAPFVGNGNIFSAGNESATGVLLGDIDPLTQSKSAYSLESPRSIEGPFLTDTADRAAASTVPFLVTAGGHGAISRSYAPQRTPYVFKTVATAAAGDTAIWTPAAGKLFRLMRWRYTVTDNATLAAPGVLTVTLNDAGGAIGQADDVFVPAIALVNNGQLAVSPWIDLGNGVLSGAANNALNVNLSAALTAGTVRVQVCGTEE